MKNVLWEPCSQDQYEILMDKTPLLFLHSGRGTGKSQILAVKAMMGIGIGLGADWKVLVVRQSYGALSDLVLKFNFFISQLFKGKFSYNGSEHRYKFNTGEQIQFAYLCDEKSYQNNLHGKEYALILVDEVTNFRDYDLLEKLFTLLRNTNPNIIPQIVLSTNPSGPGFSWCKKVFIDNQKNKIPFRAFGRDAKSYHLKIEDNFHLIKNNPEYLEQLEALPQHLKDSWRFGLWKNNFDSMFFDMFDPNFHVIKDFPIPETWRIERGFDWGSASPFAVLYKAEIPEKTKLPNGKVIPKGSQIFFNEWYGAKQTDYKTGLRLTIEEIAAGILAREEKWGISKRVMPGGADLSIYSDLGFGISLGDKLNALGVPFSKEVKKGKGSRVAGWEIIKSMLRNATEPVIERPCLLIMESCAHLIREMNDATYATKGDPHDLDTDGSDHALDACSYMLRLNPQIVSASSLPF